MAIDTQEVETLAQLARLKLSPEEVQETTRSIDGILSMIDRMQAVDTTSVTPLAHANEARQRLREDVVTQDNQRDRLQSVAPSVENGFYRVPKVIE